MELKEALLLLLMVPTILVIAKITVWRELLALRLPQLHFTAGEPVEDGTVIAPLWQEREAELLQLGFEPFARGRLILTPAIYIISDTVHFYLSPNRQILAQLTVEFHLIGSIKAQLTLISRAADGKFLYRTERLSADNSLSNPQGQNSFVDSFASEELYVAHGKLIAGRPLLPWPEVVATLALLNGAEEEQIAENLRRGWLRRREDGSFSLTWRGLWACERTKKPDQRKWQKAPVPTARLALFHWIYLDQRRRHFLLDQDKEWTFLLVTAGLSLLVGAVYFDLTWSLLLFLVILIHEGGHWLTMRLLGYRRVHIMFLPLLGGIAIGENEKASATDQAWTFLMGPLPGIVLALALFFSLRNFPALRDFIRQDLGLESRNVSTFIYLLLFINGLNLLPIMPLDGGQLLRVLLPRRALGLATFFCGISCCAVLGTAFYGFNLSFLLLPLIFMASHFWGLRRCLKHWREEKNSSPLRDFQQALAIVRATNPKKDELKWQLTMAQELVQTINFRPLDWSRRLFFILLWLGCLAAIYGFFEYVHHLSELKRAAGK